MHAEHLPEEISQGKSLKKLVVIFIISIIETMVARSQVESLKEKHG